MRLSIVKRKEEIYSVNICCLKNNQSVFPARFLMINLIYNSYLVLDKVPIIK